MSFLRRSGWSCAGGLVLLLVVSVEADTVYLKNGAYIDGTVRGRRGDLVEVQIGKMGKIEIKSEDIYEIEKNSRTGEENVRTTERDEAVEEYTREAHRKRVLQGDGAGSGDEPENETEKSPGSDPSSVVDSEAPPIDPQLEGRIEQAVLDLQRQRARFRTRAERQLKSIGSPAVPYVLPVAKTESDLARIAVYRILHEIGDDRVIETCVDGLLDTNEYVRDLANKTLKKVTGQDLSYQPQASPRRREAAQAKWAKWWNDEKERRAEELEFAATKSAESSTSDSAEEP